MLPFDLHLGAEALFQGLLHSPDMDVLFLLPGLQPFLLADGADIEVPDQILQFPDGEAFGQGVGAQFLPVLFRYRKNAPAMAGGKEALINGFQGAGAGAGCW